QARLLDLADLLVRADLLARPHPAHGLRRHPAMAAHRRHDHPGLDPWSAAGIIDVIKHLILPVISLVAVVYAQFLMIMRASLIEEMSEDYLTTARAKGLTEDEVRRRHAVPNALLPTVTVVFLHIGGLIAGAVTVEAVFSWPGLDRKSTRLNSSHVS